MVQDVEILTSGERKRVLSLEKRRTNTCKHLSEGLGRPES